MAFIAPDPLRLVAKWIRTSQHPVALTGAGMSTESGIPDFRSRGGTWEDPELLQKMTQSFLLSNPELFWPAYKDIFLNSIHVSAKPNQGHRVLGEWERIGTPFRIVTQNVDGLHQSAGSRQVLEVHGNSKKAFCPRCDSKYGLLEILGADVPRCTWETPKGGVCDTILHPDTVLFEQSVHDFATAVNWFRHADLVLVLGTSLTVEPVASLPNFRQSGVKLVIVNLEKTHLDNQADAVFHHRIGEVLPLLDQEMRDGQWRG